MSDTQENSPVVTPTINRYYLRHLRENVAQLTVEKFASEIGVPPKFVRDWEAGRKQPNQKHCIALEKFFHIATGGLVVEIKHIFIEDFIAAYFGNEDARIRINWADDRIKFAQSLDILPPQPKKRKS